MKSKLFTLLISFLAALALWVYVVTVVNPEGDTIISDIPVTFSGAEVLREDHGLVITGDHQEFVSVHYYGKNADMKKLEQNKNEIRAVVDVSNVRSTKEYSLSYELTYPSAVPASAVTRVEKMPASITIQVEREIRKTVEVVCDFSGVEIADGYMLDSTDLDYDSITVEGPASIVNTVQQAQIVLSRTNVDKTITESANYTLVDANGDPVDTDDLRMSVDTVEVSINVVQYREIPLEISYIAGGGATADDVRADISPKSITLAGDATVLEGLNGIQLDPIDLSRCTSNKESIALTIPIPANAKNISGEEEAIVTIEILGKSIKNVRTTNINFTGQTEGFKPESMTQQLSVTVRADEKDIANITSNNVRVVVDLSGRTEAGRYQLPATVYIDGFPTAGVIGEYTVGVALSKVDDETE